MGETCGNGGSAVKNYELVAGLETHIELSTNTKIFCGCTTAFGNEPNTNCCPVCLGFPGTLPKLNREVVNYAIRAGLATNCEITLVSKMDRKNYVYPDLPKAYQISQFDKPLCQNGWIELDSGKKIRILRIHIEEDAGKLVHRGGNTYVDYNRGGVPLIEIVTEPDIRSIEETVEYLEKLQLIMKYIGVSDCKMQEGSMRCDVNISVRPVGAKEYGTRAEIKNMNSFTFISKAMAYEFERQVELIESGGQVIQETRRFDDVTGETEGMRGKEDAQDYRYFRDPDLVTIIITPEQIEQLRGTLPELPQARLARYIDQMGIAPADAEMIVKYRRVSDLFDGAAKGLSKPQTVANLIVGQIFRRMPTENEKEACELKITAEMLGELAKLIESGKLRMNIAKNVLEKMLDTGSPVSELVSEKDLAGVDEDTLRNVCADVIAQNVNAVADYRAGKEKALGSLVGGVMKATKGRADAVRAQELLIELMAQP